MSDDSRISELVEEALSSGRTPEEVCADFPELLWEVRERWRRCRLLEAQIDTLFPTSGLGAKMHPDRPRRPTTKLPRIPGYDVEAVLGHGGMGVVYKARHLKLDRSVAIKMLLAGAYATQDELACLMREAQAVAALRHANIVQVHDVGELEGLPYFTMEFVEGGSLAQRLRGVPQPAREAAAMLVLLAGAVHTAHQAGVVHRDLKPSNVLLTTDGSPKITDFGLARRLKGDVAHAARTNKAGTPGYMAPEQALGKAVEFCPSVDIYSLGAILYEMLTGRPPFQAETPSETQRQLIEQDPVPPSRLNAKVPRDLETICLKCLRKDPARRYPVAGALADDVMRFERGEPILARPLGVVGRVGKWVRRRPGLAAMLATTLLLGAALLGAMLWLAAHRAQLRQAIETDLREAAELRRRALWSDARAALARARTRRDATGVVDLRQRLAQAERDCELMIRLDAIHLRRLTGGELPFYKAQAARDYAAAFTDASIGKLGDGPKETAARIAASAVADALVAAMDDWIVCTFDEGVRLWLFEVTNLSDHDPTGWRQRIRDSKIWNEPAALAALAREVPIAAQSVSTLLALGERLRATGGDAPAFLRRVQNQHPADFWANLTLGDALLAASPLEAAGHYRAALAIRPGAAVGYTSLGDTFTARGMGAEAIEQHRRAVQVDPRYARGHTNLANLLRDSGRIDEAIACYRTALAADPNYAWAHYDLANTLRDVGRMDEAMEHYRRYRALDSTNTEVWNILRADRVARGQGEEVRLEWERILAADPPGHDAWFGYAELCLFLGQEDEYRRARRDLLRRFGSTTDPYVAERTARAMLLLPAEGDELRVASGLAEHAAAARGTTPASIYQYFRFAQGLAEYRRGRFDSAISIMSTDAPDVMGPSPRLVIAMAQHRAGQVEAARSILSAEIRSFDWALAQTASRDHWIWHILRREAEAMIFPDTSAFLEGRRQPEDNVERLALLGVCRFENRNHTAATLYADALAADPTLCADPRTRHRYNAACVAALAGCGLGADAGKLGEAERARWRRQARQWLGEELNALEVGMRNTEPWQRAPVERALIQWQASPDLAGIRDAGSPDKLSGDERGECVDLWGRIAATLHRARAEIK